MIDEKSFNELLNITENIIQECGTSSNFDSKSWLTDWLNTPNISLGNKEPKDFLATDVGFDNVKNILLRMQSGAYS